ncbi:MAG: hypothetical protein V3U73_05575, partial [bacterium]
ILSALASLLEIFVNNVGKDFSVSGKPGSFELTEHARNELEDFYHCRFRILELTNQHNAFCEARHHVNEGGRIVGSN